MLLKGMAAAILFVLLAIGAASASWGANSQIGYGDDTDSTHRTTVPDVYCISWDDCMAVWIGSTSPVSPNMDHVVYSKWDGSSWSSGQQISTDANFTQFRNPRVAGIENASHSMYRLVWQANKSSTSLMHSYWDILTATWNSTTGAADPYSRIQSELDEHSDVQPSVSCFNNPLETGFRCVAVWAKQHVPPSYRWNINYWDSCRPVLFGGCMGYSNNVSDTAAAEAYPDIECLTGPVQDIDQCFLVFSEGIGGNYDIYHSMFNLSRDPLLLGGAWSAYAAIQPATAATSDERPRASHSVRHRMMAVWENRTTMANYELAYSECTAMSGQSTCGVWSDSLISTTPYERSIDISCHDTSNPDECKVIYYHSQAPNGIRYREWLAAGGPGFGAAASIPGESGGFTPAIHCPELDPGVADYCAAVWVESPGAGQPDRVYASVYNENAPPTDFQASDSGAGTIRISTNVTFFGNWTDTTPITRDNVYLLISDSGSFEDCDYNGKSGCMAYSGPRTDGEAKIRFNTTAQAIAGGVTEITWYARACDSKNQCTSPVSGAYSIDNKAPIITRVNVTNIGTARAKLAWTTDESANSSAIAENNTHSIYRTNKSASYVDTPHSLWVTGLSADRLYFYNVTSCDPYWNCNTSANSRFVTPANMGTLKGWVYDAFRRPMYGVSVGIAGLGAGYSYDCTTDINGNYSAEVAIVGASSNYNVTASLDLYATNTSEDRMLKSLGENATSVRIVYVGKDDPIDIVSAPGMGAIGMLAAFALAAFWYAFRHGK